MKKIILGTLAAALVLAMPADLRAQGFLKKLKQKAEKAVNKVVGIEEEEEAAAEEQEESKGTPTATDRIPKLRQTSFIWDGQVKPSTASSVQALMNELPALPSVKQIAEPDRAEHEAYYNRLSAVSMRVDELDEQWACNDEEMLALRDKLYSDLAETYGISVEEMKRLEDPDISEAEKARIEEAIKRSVLGGMSEERIANTAAGMEAKHKKYEARLKELQKEGEALEKKEKAGTLTEADRARAEQLRQEVMAIQQDMFGGSDVQALMNIGKKGAALQQKFSANAARMEQRLKVYADKAAALQKSEEGIVQSCNEIADKYEDELKSLYEQIYREEDVDKIHALYDRADELMKNYRTSAARIWLQSLNTRLENTKKLLPEAMQIYADMAKEGLIPECATRRASLNVVTNCADILDEAYADFPQPSVLPYHTEAMGILEEGESVLFTESGFIGGFGSGSSSLFDSFSAGSKVLIYNNKEKAYYKLENGRRTRLDGEGPFNFFDAKAKVECEYGAIPLRKGNRSASFNAGRVLVLHDGTYVHPVAMRRYADRIEFVVYNTVNGKPDFYQCTYKL